MSTTFTVFLILIGIFTAMCIWALNLKINRHAKAARWGSLAGILILFIMFFYSIDYVKGANYTPGLVIGLSVGTTIVWVLACAFMVGLLIIIAVGLYWVVTMFKNHSLKDMWEMMKADFIECYSKLKAWAEGEED